MNSQTNSPLKLLIVDDEPALRELLAFEFELQGFEVSTAAGGHEAWALLQSKAFDGILTDVRMPEGDAFWLLRKLRDESVKIPVVLMTGFMEVREGADEEARELITGLPIVAKPFELEALGKTVIQAIRPDGASQGPIIQEAI